MRDADCAAFLQWALPRLDLDWAGYRKVRGQVCKRVRRRMRDLGVRSFAEYRERLEADRAERRVLDGLCHITISRFCRDRGVFDMLAENLLPGLAGRVQASRRELRAWSAGCASGEEPYTLKILWDLRVAPDFPKVALSITATDLDAPMLERARRACYPRGSLRELPRELAEQAFEPRNGELCLRPPHRQGIRFLLQDLRREAPQGPFDLVLCRNLAFTYFSPPLQERVLARILATLRCGGLLVIGNKEQLPPGFVALRPTPGNPGIFILGGRAPVGRERPQS